MSLQSRRSAWPSVVAALALVVLVGTLVLAGWLALQEGGPLAALQRSAPPDVLRLGLGTPLNTLDPALATTPAERALQAMLFEGVVAPGPDATLAPEPRLAEALPQASPDGLVWTIHCRRNVRFHDGSSFTCRDVQARFDSLRAEIPTLAANDSGPDPTTLIALLEHIKSTEITGDYTLDVRLRAPFAFFNEALAHPAAAITHGDAGTGPFLIESWNAAGASLAAFDDYWAGPPELRRVEVSIIPDQAARIDGLGDTLDVIDNPPPTTVFDDDSHTLLSGPGAQITYVAINDALSPLDNPQIQEALRLGLDWQAVAAQAFGGHAQPAPYFTGPATPGYESLSPLQPDLRRAREAQANAGLPDGYDTNLFVDRHTANYQAVTEAMRFQFAALYIEGTAETLSVPLEEAFSGNPPTQLVVAAYTPMDAYAALVRLAEPPPPNGRNFVRYENATYRAYVEQAVTALTPGARDTALSAARGELANTPPPVVYLVAPDVLAATTADVSGLRLSPLGWVVVTRDTLRLPR